MGGTDSNDSNIKCIRLKSANLGHSAWAPLRQVSQCSFTLTTVTQSMQKVGNGTVNDRKKNSFDLGEAPFRIACRVLR